MNGGMEDYYADHLTAEKLRRGYEIAPPRLQQYLRAELDFATEVDGSSLFCILRKPEPAG